MTLENSLVLRDGRRLGFQSSGDPDGQPVFFFHGTPGSRRFLPPEAITRRLGVRLITSDRPGYGMSDFQPGRRLSDWPRDVNQIADHLGLTRFRICGHSGGGPHTLACAALLPDRVVSAATLSGAGPYDTPGATAGMVPLNRIGFVYGRYLPWPIWRLMIWITHRQRQRDPEAAIDRDTTRPQADETLMRVAGIRDACVLSETEAFRQGLRGMAWDAHLIVRPWDFRLEQIRLPVHVWHGTADNSTPFAMAQYLVRSIPHATLHVLENEAHLLFFPHWEEILSTLIAE